MESASVVSVPLAATASVQSGRLSKVRRCEGRCSQVTVQAAAWGQRRLDGVGELRVAVSDADGALCDAFRSQGLSTESVTDLLQHCCDGYDSMKRGGARCGAHRSRCKQRLGDGVGRMGSVSTGLWCQMRAVLDAVPSGHGVGHSSSPL